MKVIEKPSFFISAGEHSGDVIAADLVAVLRTINSEYQCFAFAGKRVKAAGAEIIASNDGVNVMGIGGVFAKLGDFKLLADSVLAEIERRKPKFAVLVDYPGFHFYLAERLKLMGIPVIQYIAPKLWAWGEGRAEKLRADFNLVLGILPFEKDFFTKRGVNYKYIGSPHLRRCTEIKISRELCGIKTQEKILALLPGSRPEEIDYIFPHLIRTVAILKRNFPHLKVVIPIAENIDESDFRHHFFQETENVPSQTQEFGGFKAFNINDFIFVKGGSLEIMALADAAIVASGTATLECALLGIPFCVVYAMSESSWYFATESVKLPFVSLVNLILNKALVEEYLQYISPHACAAEVTRLLSGGKRVDLLREGFAKIRQILAKDASFEAAMAIKDFIAF